MDNGRLVRYTSPTKFDGAEYGQIWERILEDFTHELWIQTSQDEANPSWIRIGSFLEKVFSARLYDDEFLKECLEKYK